MGPRRVQAHEPPGAAAPRRAPPAFQGTTENHTAQ